VRRAGGSLIVLTRGLLGASLAVAAVLASGLIATSLIGAGSSEAGSVASPTAQPAGEPALLRGLPQDGRVLGSPDAPVTLVEYADLQCPYCAQWARGAFPELVRDYVRPGRLRIEFRGLAFLGPDSEVALRTALAAGEQDRLWDMLHLLYANQGGENAGWVTQDLLDRIGGAVPGLDRARMLGQRWSAPVERELAAAAAAAERDRVSGTPAFFVGPTGGKLEPVMLSSLDAGPLQAQLDSVLAR
jgi:protein-disulfide isomerase